MLIYSWCTVVSSPQILLCFHYCKEYDSLKYTTQKRITQPTSPHLTSNALDSCAPYSQGVQSSALQKVAFQWRTVATPQVVTVLELERRVHHDDVHFHVYQVSHMIGPEVLDAINIVTKAQN